MNKAVTAEQDLKAQLASKPIYTKTSRSRKLSSSRKSLLSGALPLKPQYTQKEYRSEHLSSNTQTSSSTTTSEYMSDNKRHSPLDAYSASPALSQHRIVYVSTPSFTG